VHIANFAPTIQPYDTIFNTQKIKTMYYKTTETLAAVALLLALGCKREAAIMPAQNATPLMEQAQLFVKAQAPQADFDKLDWARAITYYHGSGSQVLRIPLRGNTKATQRAAYLTYANGRFGGNYFEIQGNRAITVSLNNRLKYRATLTANGQVGGMETYENGQWVQQDATGVSVGAIRPTQYFYINYDLYCMLDLIGMGQGGEAPNNTPQGTVSYLVQQDDPINPGGNGTGSAPTGGTITINYTYLATELSPTDEQYQWLLANPLEAAQLYVYLQSGLQPNRVSIAKGHLQAIVSNMEYMDFVKNHTATGNPLLVWWEDTAWTDVHMNMDFEHYPVTATAPPQDLTDAERALIIQYPYEAWMIRGNGNKALAETKDRFPGARMLNSKADAFRHAYWLARNAKSVGGGLALLFGVAHESEVPPQFILEKQMDLYNNSVGVGLYQSNMSNSELAIAAMNAVLTGLCRYLSPIDYDAPCFWNCPGNPLGNHGISSQTQLIPTNQ
jgi:hypothetical protein